MSNVLLDTFYEVLDYFQQYTQYLLTNSQQYLFTCLEFQWRSFLNILLSHITKPCYNLLLLTNK